MRTRLIVILLIVAPFLATAGTAIYQNPNGWAIETNGVWRIEELMQLERSVPAARQLGRVPTDGLRFAEEIASCRGRSDMLRCSIFADKLLIDRHICFVAVLADSTRVRARRMLCTEGPEQRRVYDSSRESIVIGGLTPLATINETGGICAVLDFPYDSIAGKEIVRFELVPADVQLSWGRLKAALYQDCTETVPRLYEGGNE